MVAREGPPWLTPRPSSAVRERAEAAAGAGMIVVMDVAAVWATLTMDEKKPEVGAGAGAGAGASGGMTLGVGVGVVESASEAAALKESDAEGVSRTVSDGGVAVSGEVGAGDDDDGVPTEIADASTTGNGGAGSSSTTKRVDRGRERDRSADDRLDRRTWELLESPTGEPARDRPCLFLEKMSRMRPAGETEMAGASSATRRVRDRDGRSKSGA
jgi:hypothetical protein